MERGSAARHPSAHEQTIRAGSALAPAAVVLGGRPKRAPDAFMLVPARDTLHALSLFSDELPANLTLERADGASMICS